MNKFPLLLVEIFFLFGQSKTLMEGCSRNGEICPKLLDLMIPQGRRNWFQDDKVSVYNTEEKKLELKLGPPGEDEDEDCTTKMILRRIKQEPKDKSILCLAGNHFSPSSTTTTNNKTTSQKRFDFFFPSHTFLFLSVLYPFDMMIFT